MTTRVRLLRGQDDPSLRIALTPYSRSSGIVLGVFMLLSLAATSVRGSVIDVRSAVKEVVIQPGDTPESLAREHLGDPNAAEELLRFNNIPGNVLPAPGTAIRLPGEARFRAAVQLHYARCTLEKAKRGDAAGTAHGGEELLREAEDALRGAQYTRCVELANRSWKESSSAIIAAKDATKLSIATSAGKEDRLAVTEGEVTLRGGGAGASTTVSEGQAAIIGKGKASAAVRDRLEPPEVVSPVDAVLYNVDVVVLKWKPVEGATSYKVVVGTDPEIDNQIGPEVSTDASSIERAVGVGQYFWRVMAIDEQGVDGMRSRPVSFRVETDTSPPRIRLDKPQWE